MRLIDPENGIQLNDGRLWGCSPIRIAFLFRRTSTLYAILKEILERNVFPFCQGQLTNQVLELHCREVLPFLFFQDTFDLRQASHGLLLRCSQSKRCIVFIEFGILKFVIAHDCENRLRYSEAACSCRYWQPIKKKTIKMNGNFICAVFSLLFYKQFEFLYSNDWRRKLFLSANLCTNNIVFDTSGKGMI